MAVAHRWVAGSANNLMDDKGERCSRTGKKLRPHCEGCKQVDRIP